MGRRAALSPGPQATVKTYRRAADALAEIAWYQRVPWAAPRLLDADPATGRLVLQTLPVALDRPAWRPAAALAELLTALHRENIHHRDVHLRNLLIGPGGAPLLIDWETAIDQRARYSYDLYGPEVSGVPVPAIHTGLTPQWWASAAPMSIRRRWGIDVPTCAA